MISADFSVGGRPYIDLEKAVEYLENTDKFSYIDFKRTVALGASYGGYMINYIQGKPLGRKFKALVCHDGVFSTLNQYSSEELYFPQHDVSSPPFDIFTHPLTYIPTSSKVKSGKTARATPNGTRPFSSRIGRRRSSSSIMSSIIDFLLVRD